MTITTITLRGVTVYIIRLGEVQGCKTLPMREVARCERCEAPRENFFCEGI